MRTTSLGSGRKWGPLNNLQFPFGSAKFQFDITKEQADALGERFRSMTEVEHSVSIKVITRGSDFLFHPVCSCGTLHEFSKSSVAAAAPIALKHLEDVRKDAQRLEQGGILQRAINRATFLVHASVMGGHYNSTWYVNLELYQILEKKAKEITTDFLYIRETGTGGDVMLHGIPVRVRPSVTKLTLECWAQ